MTGVDGRGEAALWPALEAWCAGYVAAFSAYETSAIAAHWAFPAMIVQGARRFTFEDVDRFTANTDGLMAFYRARGVVRAERTLVSAMAMGPQTAAIAVDDVMRDGAGGALVSWRAAYVLKRHETAPAAGPASPWRAIWADGTGETEAWAAAGTPLGGSHRRDGDTEIRSESDGNSKL